MLRLSNLKTDIHTDTAALSGLAAKKLRISPADISQFKIAKKSIDSRDKDNIRFVYSVDFAAPNEQRLLKNKDVTKLTTQEYQIPVGKPHASRPVIVGAGPAGLFAANILAEAGLAPIVLERGQPVKQRTLDIDLFHTSRILNENSNIQFGEGGAGTFSDGKLTTGISNERISYVLRQFVECGAPEEIAYLAKPHIGTDKLIGVVSNLRQKAELNGAQFIFGAKFTGFTAKGDTLTNVSYIDNTGNTHTVDTPALVLAIGHSARDTVETLHESGLHITPKAFSVGVRIEHSQQFINESQYGKFAGDPALGSASYKLSHRLANGRGVYTFCMCPGGTVVGAASEHSGVVTNGMSRYARALANANSALLVSVTPQDFAADGETPHPLAGIAFQHRLERLAFELGGANYNAPIQLVGDFLAMRESKEIGRITPTYMPGVTPANLTDCLPAFIIEGLREGILAMDKKIADFANPEAVLTAVESRSSSPVVIKRNPDSFQANIAGVFPCGEGAGYAGGIMSAAVDGIITAEKVIALTNTL
ncbi:MAG: FAD-dependent monooxygenase [Defluviitaleaceae bacterium]|nr:FAD-dependent monooxygenase [Defluviitaleaceae bacterium]